MFENIGKKIKSLANILCWVGIIGYVIAGIVLICIDSDTVGIGVTLLIVGPFVSWVSSFFMYGFGELVDKVCDIERNTCDGESKSTTQNKIDYARIDKIENLRSQGLITEEEYQQAISKENN